MKKIFLTLSIILMVIVLIGADIRRNSPSTTTLVPAKIKKKCVGYTVIEFGKGIDCNGDTVRLVKVHGGQVLAQQ